MRKISAARQSWLILLGVFLLMWALNALCYRFYGDDYLYSFVWEGHAMSVPLSAHARRIQGFGDIFYSLKLHYMTWGGRMVAHFFTMLFLWVGKGWFDVVNAGMVVLLLLAMQWIAMGGKVTAKLSPFITALSFFCIWTFNMSFGGTLLWVAGSCNYLWTSVFLLLFLIPYVRHYLTDGQANYPSWFGPLWLVMGMLAGNSNENTICWIGLSGGIYLLYAWKRKTLSAWMLWGLIGLGIGYFALMLAPGNVARLHEDYGMHRPFVYMDEKHLGLLWMVLIIQSLMWFYLFKVWRRREILRRGGVDRKYFRLAAWFAVTGLLFALIMLFSPIFPGRSVFPQLVFLAISVLLISAQGEVHHTSVLQKSAFRFLYGMAVLYMVVTGTVNLVVYSRQHQYMQAIWERSESLRGKGQVLVISTPPPASDDWWMFMSGMHVVEMNLSNDDENWENVAFARYFGLKGVHVTYPVKEEQ